MSGKVLVTGGAGFIGSWVVEQLASLGNDVIVLDNLRSGKRENLKDAFAYGKVKLVEGDIRDMAVLDKVMPGVDCVYHLAVEALTVGLEDPFLMDDVNSRGTLNVLYSAHKHNIKRFNYVSSSEVYGNAQTLRMSEKHPTHPYTTYSASKLNGEEYTIAFHNCYGLNYTIIRPFNSYGPRHRTDSYCAVIFRFLERYSKNMPPVIYGNGRQSRDFSFVKDTARGIALAGESKKTLNDVINIGTGKELSVNHIARAIGTALGKERITPVYESVRPGDVMRHCADISKARRLLGFKPEYDFETGIAETISWYSKKHNLNW
ncbi:MAG: GDP-mannose 4,6-dehydratase [Candidatus Norongarragalinales archaeon]